ncbi:hypothetical protein [Francisella sp. 19X1-34]|uniref:hypothetical protein n=1 Tax=Francisella sp. 19X1-34 TaxID=3087177 RepID=UPI002E30CA14|nr:hypothetical protein [Francisella sp. 19X1-34]MED7789677.1 hypothetical protein [Francisella sp. 19X1-34]
MLKGILECPCGKQSAKRVWGAVLLIIGILFSIILFIYCLFDTPADTSMESNIINMFMITGGSLLGISVFEGLLKKKSTDINEKI